MSKESIEVYFRNLSRSGYSITSPATPEYNCIAWAAGNAELWWEPDPQFLYYWPPQIERRYTLEAYKRTYEVLGYKICDNSVLEIGFEKIVLYINEYGRPTHAARQLISGRWTSKLGSLEDIEHNTLEGLSGSHPAYGIVAVILKRPIKNS